jgi:hypothetical protein
MKTMSRSSKARPDVRLWGICISGVGYVLRHTGYLVLFCHGVGRSISYTKGSERKR